MSSEIQVDGLIERANIATCDVGNGAAYGLFNNGCLAWRDGKICYVGPNSEAKKFRPDHVIDAAGRLVTPGFIDCHTHLVFAGDRSNEFAARLSGQTYAAIAKEGGGIMATVKSTRDCDEPQLIREATQRIQRLFSSGVTCVEIKSGYGLDSDSEIKMLRVIKTLDATLPVTIKATCLAAHTLPKDFSGSADDYIDWVCKVLLPMVKEENLADAVDIFCESIAFSSEHMQQLFREATSMGFSLKGHVEQLSQNNGIDVICQYGGQSADHIEYADEHQVSLMSKAGTTAVLLPGAYYYLGESQKPPVDLLRKHGVAMAVATDLNPGSSPLYSITQAANMASVLFGLTPEESILGISTHAAKALGLGHCKGQLAKGMDADFVLWPFESPSTLVYELPCPRPTSVWVAGKNVTNVAPCV